MVAGYDEYISEDTVCLIIDLLDERLIAHLEGGLISAHPRASAASEYGAREIHGKVFTIFSWTSKDTFLALRFSTDRNVENF
jgi:hypothetical protein